MILFLCELFGYTQWAIDGIVRRSQSTWNIPIFFSSIFYMYICSHAYTPAGSLTRFLVCTFKRASHTTIYIFFFLSRPFLFQHTRMKFFSFSVLFVCLLWNCCSFPIRISYVCVCVRLQLVLCIVSSFEFNIIYYKQIYTHTEIERE